ncbi:hypothetical protein GCM10009801_13250 [Streptomyces albiaxialis]|uniref:Uncharacterized protein n=1 Tax=Streptomyces albiaxialis TaxID=329523 RepID=A0ABN2VPS4_9ACTN
MSYPQAAPMQGAPHPVPQPGRAASRIRKPGVLAALPIVTALAALSGAIGSFLVFSGGKDIADENVRNAVDSNPEAVGLQAGVTSADIKELAGGPLWDSVVTEWQSTMEARALIAMVFGVGLLLFALFVRKAAVWARVMSPSWRSCRPPSPTCSSSATRPPPASG